MKIYLIVLQITFINQAISDSLNCDFNLNDCTWYPIGQTSINWHWTGQRSADSHGGYLEVPNESPSIGQYSSSSSSSTNQLISGSIRNLWYIPRSGCFSFSYRFYFIQNGWLNLTLTPIVGDSVLLYSIKDGRSLDWSRVSVDIGNSPEFYLVFSFSLETSSSNDNSKSTDWIISLDDFNFISGVQCSDFNLCDFETGSCHWKLSGWQRVTAGQSIPVDHTTSSSSGHFIEPKVFGSTSSLSLAPLPSNILEGCLAFWTNIDLKRSMPQLYVRQDSGNRWKVDLNGPMVNNNNDPSSSWQYHQITVSLKSLISIETIASSSSQLAIDDLILYNQSCPSIGSCDFSYDFCGWVNSGKLPWRRQIGLLSSLSVSGSFPTIKESFDRQRWYVISDQNRAKGQAIFESRPMVISSLICFGFSYFYTSTNFQRNENLLINLNDVSGKLINHKLTTQVDKIPLESTSSLNWIKFERTINVKSNDWVTISLTTDQQSHSSIVLVDDIEIKSDKCSNESPSNQLITTTSIPTTTMETDCCVSEPCICVNSGEMSTINHNYETTTPSFFEQSVVPAISESTSTTIDLISTKLNNQQTTASAIDYQSTTEIYNDLETKSTTDLIFSSTITTESTSESENDKKLNLITTFTSSTKDQSTTITINTNQQISSTPLNTIKPDTLTANSITPVTSSPIDSVSTVNFEQLTETDKVTDENSVTELTINTITEAIDQIINQTEANNLISENTTINSSNSNERLIIGNLGNNLISIVNLVFDEKPLIASISGIVGLIFLIFGIIVLTASWKKSTTSQQQSTNRQTININQDEMELQTITFRRRTINSNVLKLLSQQEQDQSNSLITFLTVLSTELLKMMSQNIKVYVRCRPLKESEIRNDTLTVKREKKEVILKDKTFVYDNIFTEESTQIEIYRSVLAPLIDQVLDGYNCTVFAYGQTGTGKTFTMEGKHTLNCSDWQSDPLAGLVPRSFCQLFECLEGRDCTIKVSFLELYNEELYDLLAASDDIVKLKMFDDINKKGSVIVCNLEETVITSKDEVYKLLQKGSAKRQTAATLLNACSSRSHTIFTITVYVTDETANGDEMVRIGKLNLVDLAGSESLSRSGAVDRRAREATCINQSLLSLGRVINCLVNKSTAHIPYRESKLTRLLQDSLGGKTRTSIVATISPSIDDCEDTASTLEYAQRAKRITNKPEANKRINKKAFLRDYAEKISKLQKDLRNCINKEGIYLDGDDYNTMIDKVAKHDKMIEEIHGQIAAQIQEMERVNKDLQGTKRILKEKEEELENKTKKMQRILSFAENSSKDATILFKKVSKLKNNEANNKKVIEQLQSNLDIQDQNFDRMVECRMEELQDRIENNAKQLRDKLTTFTERFATSRSWIFASR
ncbi:kinesin-related protein 9-like [Panonychus citri]|uniref:kinesin-related protein 9-like n=1 Tax=Panonychus citri TaxID=50023 RepID=UPI0023073F55|nr:kinesin-related protein 9-like [Panonychus citri]